MIRLLIAVAVLGLAIMYMLSHQKEQQQQEVIYHEQLDKAEAVEDQLQEQLKERMQHADEMSQ